MIEDGPIGGVEGDLRRHNDDKRRINGEREQRIVAHIAAAGVEAVEEGAVGNEEENDRTIEGKKEIKIRSVSFYRYS